MFKTWDLRTWISKVLFSPSVQARTSTDLTVTKGIQTSLVAQRWSVLITMQNTRVRSLSREDPLATHSSTLAWKIPWMEKPGGLQSMGSQRVGQDWATSPSLSPAPRQEGVKLGLDLPSDSLCPPLPTTTQSFESTLCAPKERFSGFHREELSYSQQ